MRNNLHSNSRHLTSTRPKAIHITRRRDSGMTAFSIRLKRAVFWAWRWRYAVLRLSSRRTMVSFGCEELICRNYRKLKLWYVACASRLWGVRSEEQSFPPHQDG